MTSPPLSPEAVAQMVAELREKNPIAGWWAVAPDAADMLTTLAAENATLRHDRDVAVVNSDVLRIAMDTLRAERDDLKSAMTPTPDAELDAFVDFMCGAGEFDGAWFGDAHHSLSGHFWWRTRLRKTIATLRAERDEARTWLGAANNEFGSAAWDWPDLWRRIARLKELSNSRWQSLTDVETELATLRASEAAALERVKVLTELMQWSYDTLGEINPSNYDHDDVCSLNNKSIEVILALHRALPPTADKEPKT